jgi:hypothetical protein
MSGFEFTPGGVINRLHEGSNTVAPATPIVAAPPPAPTRPGVSKAPAPIREKPQDIVKLARARLREVEREIKRLQKLEKERDELRRLIDAAWVAHATDNNPRAVVRDIAAAKRG